MKEALIIELKWRQNYGAHSHTQTHIQTYLSSEKCHTRVTWEMQN